MLLSIAVNLSSTVNGTQSASQAASLLLHHGGGSISIDYSIAVLTQYRLVTDGRTDRRTNGQMDGHTTTAYTALGQRRAVKKGFMSLTCFDAGLRQSLVPYHTISCSINNVADIRNLQQSCSIEHYQSGRTKVKKNLITMFIHSPNKEILFIK